MEVEGYKAPTCSPYRSSPLQEAQNAVEQCRCVTSKLQLAEQANRQARNMEKDYEEVIRSLEEQLLVQQVRGPARRSCMKG
jgi:hypothetical protein